MGQRRYEQLADRAWLWHRYVDQGLPVSVIARDLTRWLGGGAKSHDLFGQVSASA